MYALILALFFLLAPNAWALSFDGSFNGCTDAGSLVTGTGWDVETDTGTDAECDDADTIPLQGVQTKIMKAVINDTTAEFVREDAGIATWTESWLRYYVWPPAGETYVDGNNFIQAQGANEAANATSFFVRYRQGTGTGMWAIEATGLSDAQGEVNGVTPAGFGFIVPSAWNCVEVHWKQASGAGANDGITELFLNGVKITGVYTLDNDTVDYGDLRFGNVSALDATGAITFWYADLQNNNTGRIGCEGMPPKAAPQDAST
jgi:hypothetical protein